MEFETTTTLSAMLESYYDTRLDDKALEAICGALNEMMTKCAKFIVEKCKQDGAKFDDAFLETFLSGGLLKCAKENLEKVMTSIQGIEFDTFEQAFEKLNGTKISDYDFDPVLRYCKLVQGLDRTVDLGVTPLLKIGATIDLLIAQLLFDANDHATTFLYTEISSEVLVRTVLVDQEMRPMFELFQVDLERMLNGKFPGVMTSLETIHTTRKRLHSIVDNLGPAIGNTNAEQLADILFGTHDFDGLYFPVDYNRLFEEISPETQQQRLTDAENFLVRVAKEKVEPTSPEEQQHFQKLVRGVSLFPNVFRLEYDWQAGWGDGGKGEMLFPVYACHGPHGLCEETRVRLAATLRRLADHSQDIQPNGIVHDIIDPSLHARILSTKEVETLLSSAMDISSAEIAGCIKETDIKNMETMERARGSLQWVPSVFQCSVEPLSGKCDAKIMGQIRGLPARWFCPKLYDDIEAVFASVMPLLVPLLPFDDLNGKLQVVVKAQEYVLEPNMVYSGRWHTEGFSERIRAAAVYYIDMDSELKGGGLSFHPPKTPDENYESYFDDYVQSRPKDPYYNIRAKKTGLWDPQWDYPTKKDLAFREKPIDKVPTDYSADRNTPEDQYFRTYSRNLDPVKAGTAVAFDNAVPHRFRTLKNTSPDQPQRRLFINFFIVDPSNPLEFDNENVPSRQLLQAALGRGELAFPENVQDIIADFLGTVSNTKRLLHNVILRDKAREAMTRARPRWGDQFFGNNGDISFVQDCRKFRAADPAYLLTRSNSQHVFIESLQGDESSSRLGSGL